MATPYIGEIKIIAWNFAPKNWALCNGQLLPINQNQALFSILGTTYGGNGQTTFALPDLRGRTPLHTGNGFVLGQSAGEESHTLNISEIPAHSHAAVGSSNTADQSSPVNNYWAVSGSYTAFAGSPNEAMAPGAVSAAGGSQPHTNMPPYLVLNFVIALQGIFPSRN